MVRSTRTSLAAALAAFALVATPVAANAVTAPGASHASSFDRAGKATKHKPAKKSKKKHQSKNEKKHQKSKHKKHHKRHKPAPVPPVPPVPPPTPPFQPVLKSGTTRFSESIAPYASWGSVPIVGSGYGSAFTPEPGRPDYYYGMTDRGPNITAPDGGNKIEPFLGFQPAIGEFHLVDGKAVLVRTIGLSLPDGEPMNGRVSTQADTGETIFDVYGDVLPKSDGGLDPEGLVAMPDGSFWVSDEYGPYIVHFDATGREVFRLNPYDVAGTKGALPAELRLRKPNKGMEGLTLTPDGRYLVGIMQSPLDKNGATGPAAGKGSALRIVKVSLADYSVQEFVYTLHDSASNPEGEAVSEIAALPDGTFVVDERDGNFEGLNADGTPRADKNLWRIDLSQATDIGPDSPLIGTTIAAGAVTWDGSHGLEVGGKTLEELAGTSNGADAGTALTAAGIRPAAESLYVDYAGLLSSIDPSGMYFGHDKVEGIAVIDATHVILSNDSDFGITDEPAGPDDGTALTPYAPSEKLLPDGKTQDFGELVEIDLSQVPAQFK